MVVSRIGAKHQMSHLECVQAALTQTHTPARLLARLPLPGMLELGHLALF